MLGKYMKSNNVYKLIKDSNTNLSLTKDSNFNYILHSDIHEFILKSYNENINGIIDFTSSSNKTLEEISNILKIKANFGKYKFTTPLISNKKLLSFNPKLNKSSKETFKQFLNQI